MRTRKLLAVPALSAVALVGAPAAVAGTATDSAVSGNWSGYVAGGGSSNFSDVSGSWVQPAVKCQSGQTESAFWVGLGGASSGSSALEQTGTQADCNADGSSVNYAWYELVPAAPVKLPVAIHAGDHVTGRVSVNGTAVTVTIDDTTTGQSATRTLTMNSPDTSTAEWIAEAPSACVGGAASGNCTPLALADFGSVGFSAASATAGGHTGTINDPAWNDEPVMLSPSAAGTNYPGGVYGGFAGYGGQTSTAGATAGTLSSDGSSFSVSYSATDPAASAGAGNPYGSSGTAGYGGYNPYGYGSTGAGSSGYGSSGYGSSGYGAYGGYGGYGGYIPYGYVYYYTF